MHKYLQSDLTSERWLKFTKSKQFLLYVLMFCFVNLGALVETSNIYKEKNTFTKQMLQTVFFTKARSNKLYNFYSNKNRGSALKTRQPLELKKPQAIEKLIRNVLDRGLFRRKRSSASLNHASQQAVQEPSMNSLPTPLQYCKLTIEISHSNLVYECKLISSALESSASNLDHIANENLLSSSAPSLGNETYSDAPQEYIFRNYDRAVVRNVLQQWKVPHNVTTLMLQQQVISRLHRNAFLPLKISLLLLYLDNNEIAYIDRKSFAGLYNLKELDLSHNRIQFLPNGVFGSLIRLRKLKLMHNEIEYLREKTLCGLWSLSYLDLSDNSIEDIHISSFRQLRSAQSVVIDLRRNRLNLPRKDWLLFYEFMNDLCVADHKGFTFEQESRRQKKEKYQNRTELNTTQQIYSTRVLWGDENPWNCHCLGPLGIPDFIKTMLSFQYTNQHFLTKTTKSECESSQNCINYTHTYKVNWDVSLQCAKSENLTGLFIDTSPYSVKGVYEGCCAERSEISPSPDFDACDFLGDWLKNTTNYVIKEKTDVPHTDKQVTVIGILIVVLSPILLTLCPDCNKKVNSSLSNTYQSNNSKTVEEESNSNRVNIVVTKHFSETTNEIH